jgi:2-desacetyl-2-hydroxyethyl bacteriochlorophyllide A dehydrogenase
MKNKKVVFANPWEVEIVIEELGETSLKPEEVVIRNKYSLISPGTELACLSGNESSWFKFPSTPGYISVGEVIACGGNIGTLQKGDTVFYHGGHAQINKINALKKICLKMPEGLDGKLALFTRISSIAITAVRASDIEIGDFVCVTGLGLVGNLAAQLAQIQGGNVIGIDLNTERLKLAEACGIRYTETFDKERVFTRIKEITSGQGVRTFIEATGISQVVEDSLPFLAKGGEVILLGSPRKEFTTDLTAVLRHIHLANQGHIRFKGAHEFIYPVKSDPFVKHSIERNTIISFDLIKNNRLKVEPLITHTIQPEEAKEAYEGLRTNGDKYLGVVIDWSGS